MAAFYTFQDLSGASTPKTSDNPYSDLIAACRDDPRQIQSRYNTHRTNRNAQQKAELLSPDFPGVTIDSILAKLEDPTIEPGYKDWRHCLVFWARPPLAVRSLIVEVQRRLLQAAPNLWTMRQENLHLTALEITHSLTMPEIERLAEQIQPFAKEIADYTYTNRTHRTTLVKPMVSFDAQALALSFLPAVPESEQPVEEAYYTYHHLRRDLFDKVSATGVNVGSRYVVPSAHLTIGRFITKRDFEDANGGVDKQKLEKFVATIEEINEWVEKEYWPEGSDSSPSKVGGDWVVGEEKGLELRKGDLWYGGGERLVLGKGFERDMGDAWVGVSSTQVTI